MSQRARLTPSTDVVASSVSSLQQELLDVIQGGAEEVEVDLGQVEMIDSSGIGCLIAACNQLKDSGGKLRVTNASTDIVRLFSVMRINRHIDVEGRSGEEQD